MPGAGRPVVVSRTWQVMASFVGAGVAIVIGVSLDFFLEDEALSRGRVG